MRVLLRPKMCEITFLVSLFGGFWVGDEDEGVGWEERVHGVNSHLDALVGEPEVASDEDMMVMDG